jgi:rare lipoprotein A
MMRRGRLPYCGRINPANGHFPHNDDNRTATPLALPSTTGECLLKLKLNLLLVATLATFVVPVAITSVSAQSGIASVYSTAEGTKTASGRKLSNHALTAAHKSLPFGTKVRVTNRKNGRSVIVTITDRGPFVRGRVIDLTPAGARALGFNGLAPVSLAVEG